MNFTGPLQSQDFTTLARVKSIINSSIADSSQDALLSSFISSVSVKFTKYLACHAVKAERTEVYEVKAGQRIISLDGFPIDDSSAAVSVKLAYADTDAAFEAATALNDDEFVVNRPAGYIRMLVEQRRDPAFARVTYTGGLALAGEIPDQYPDLAFACDLQVKYLLQRHDNLGGTVSSRAGVSTTYQSSEYGLLTEVRGILDSYRRSTL